MIALGGGGAGGGGGLDLEGDVVEAELFGQHPAAGGQHGVVVDAGAIARCAVTTSIWLVSVQMCRSWTPTTPSMAPR